MNQAQQNPLKVAWDSDEATFGGWCVIPSAFSAEVLASRGFAWVAIDWQHGFMSSQVV